MRRKTVALTGRMARFDTTDRTSRDVTRRGEGRLVGKVYVRVLAEGPTRIIRFSDTDESVDDSTNEQAFDLLKAKKRQLEEDITVVHKYVACMVTHLSHQSRHAVS